MLTPTDAVKAAKELRQEARTEWVRLGRFVRYARGRQKGPWLPENTENEYRDIAKKSASNWLDLVISSTVEGLIVDGYGDKSTDPTGWEQWQANGMDARQHSLHRAIATLGYSYLIVLPSEQGGAYMRPEAATKMYARYASPDDEWPELALRVPADPKPLANIENEKLWELYDAEGRYIISNPGGSAQVEIVEHDLGVTPVAQLRWSFDLLGLPVGEIEPVIPIQDRIVDATFSLQMVAKYGAFPQRWIAGMSAVARDENGDPLVDGNGNPVAPQIKAYVDHILLAQDADTKFGQFQAADLGKYVEALEAHIRHLAAITQTPPHYLLGALVNLSAEALAAAEAGLLRKVREKREVVGEGYEQALRLASAAAGDSDAAMDRMSQVQWQDVESRSLAQTTDAITKLAQIGLPPDIWVPMIPGLSQTDVDKAIDTMKAGGAVDRMLDELTRGVTPNEPVIVPAAGG